MQLLKINKKQQPAKAQKVYEKAIKTYKLNPNNNKNKNRRTRIRNKFLKKVSRKNSKKNNIKNSRKGKARQRNQIKI